MLSPVVANLGLMVGDGRHPKSGPNQGWANRSGPDWGIISHGDRGGSGS